MFNLEQKSDSFYDLHLVAPTSNIIRSINDKTFLSNSASRFDGNVPTSATEQAERMNYITQVACQNFSHLSQSRFEDYIYYLYMSHYVDNESYDAASPNFDAILATYISEDDIKVYDTYRNLTATNNLFETLNNIYSSIKLIGTGINDAQNRLVATKNNVELLYNTIYQNNISPEKINEFIEAFIAVIPEEKNASDIIESINSYNENIDIEATVQEMLIYSLSNIMKYSLGVVGELTLGVVVSSISQQYEIYNNFIGVSALVALNATWGMRQAARTLIYIGMDDRSD